MKENTCGYSDEWQPYINDYDKYEYDIKLQDGTVIENCYPNGGLFNSHSDVNSGEDFNETEVAEIRFSQNPKLRLNHNVSNVIVEEKERVVELGRRKASSLIALTSMMANTYMFSYLPCKR